MSLASAPHPGFVRSGKVRDLFAIDDDRLLLVASDRISAFDVVLPTQIPDKGRVLTGLSRYWFAETDDIVPNHLISASPADLPAEWSGDPEAAAELRGRMMLARRVEVLPVEVIVRGYLSGTGWKDYRATGSLCGIPLPAGLRESDELPEPLFTPSTKEEVGTHDRNISVDEMEALLGGGSRARDLANRVRVAALTLYRHGAARASSASLLLADTKFEFGVLPDGTLLLVDEVMTPDSSRFWEKGAYEPGRAQASYDKQFVRDWLERSGWDKRAPGPELPADVVEGTRRRYVEAFERLTGGSFARYLDGDVIGR
jgi:phosphoribosylaminoimidazole-succinocarboxamide synthase